MFRIGDFSKLSGLTIDTLYHYEKMKILMPKEIDKFTGYRSYDASQLVTVNKLLALKDAGFSLEEIAEILNENPSTPSLLEMLEEKAESMENELNKGFDRLSRLHSNIFLIKNGGIPVMNEVTIKKVEPVLVASIRKSFGKDKFDSELEIMWEKLNRYIDLKGGKRTIPCLMLYHKGWTDMESWKATGANPLDVEEPITKLFDGNETVKTYELPAVDRVACIVHKGPFSTINETNEILYGWIRQNGYRVGGALISITLFYCKVIHTDFRNLILYPQR